VSTNDNFDVSNIVGVVKLDKDFKKYAIDITEYVKLMDSGDNEFRIFVKGKNGTRLCSDKNELFKFGISVLTYIDENFQPYKAKGYISYDKYDADLTGDLNSKWGLNDNSVGIIRAHDAIEHLRDPIHTMNEAWRVLCHGGFFMIQVPSTDGMGAWSDPTHCSYWNIRSFRHYTEEGMRRYLRGCNCRFQIVRLRNIIKWEDKIPYVEAHLIAIKEDNPRFHGLLKI